MEISSVFCLCKKSDVKTLPESKKELNFFCKEYEPAFVNDKFVLLAEDKSICLDLFENRVRQILMTT